MKLDFLRSGMAASVLAVALLTSPAAQAQALRDKVVSILEQNLKAAGAKSVTHGAVEGDDAKFTLRDLKVEMEGEKQATLTAGSIAFSGVKAAGEGYSADDIAISGFKLEDPDLTWTVGSWAVKGYVGQPAKDGKPVGDQFQRIEATDLLFDGEVKVPVASAVATASGHQDGIPHKGTFDVKGIKVPVGDSEEMKEIAALGYSELNIDVSAAGGWDDKANRLSLDNLSVNGKDAGSLKLSLALGNVTAEVMKALNAAKDDSNKQMELLQGLSVEAITIRLDNASLVDRLLDAQAKAQGIKREEFVRNISAALPVMIVALNNKDFEKKVSDAVSAFLKSPKSLVISAKPAKPVAVSEVVGTVMIAPQTLPNVLAVDIQANK